jgi:hypothetical protein
MRRAWLGAFAAITCAAILTAPSVRAQGYQFLQRNCPSCVVVFSSLTASTVTASASVQTPQINGAGGAARVLLPANATDKITSTAPATGSAIAHTLDTSSSYGAGDALLNVANFGTSVFTVSNIGRLLPAGVTSSGDLRASADNSIDLGVTGVRWRHLYIGDLRDGNAVTRITLTSASALALSGASPDGATAVGVILDTAPAFTTAGAKPVSVRTGGIEKSSIDKDGGYTVAGSGNLTVPTGNKVCLDSSCTVNLIGNGSATLTSTAGIVPSANNAVSLGTSSLRWSAVNAGLINLSGTVVKYNNVSTAALGVSPIYAYGSLAASTDERLDRHELHAPAQGHLRGRWLCRRHGIHERRRWLAALYTDCGGNVHSSLSLTGGARATVQSNAARQRSAICLSSVRLFARTPHHLAQDVEQGTATADYYAFIRQVN